MTIKTIRYKPPGGVASLGVAEAEDPGLPERNEIRVRIHGSSLNSHDYNVALGILPVADGRILMSDGTGVVEALDPASAISLSVTVSYQLSFPIGKRVMRRSQRLLEHRETVSMVMRLKR
jgi:NADPH:quinone reductase-like Zn-dependent oxidoreductase